MTEHGKRILLVDDDHFILSLLAKVLGEAGYDTKQADSGEAALALLKDHQFDLVITDVFMPGKNGIELANYVKKHHSDVPVLAISSNFSESGDNDAIGLTSYFADDSLSKPIHKDDLLLTVRGLLSNCNALSVYG